MKIEQSIIDTLTEAATGIRDERRLAANTAGRIGGMFLDIIAALGLVDTREAGVSRWGDLQDRPTTLKGFGITDAWTKEEAMELFMSREVLDDLFVKVPIETHEDEGGKTVVDRWAIRANYTLFSVGDVAAFGREDGIETGGGTGGVGSFAELGEVVDADGPTAERPYWGWIPSSGTTAGHYGWISGDGKGLANIAWNDLTVKPTQQQLTDIIGTHYLTDHQSLAGYATEQWVRDGYQPKGNYQPAGNYLTAITSQMVTDALGFTPYSDANPNGYTSNEGTVTSVALAVPTGFSVSGSPITKSGKITIRFATGYSIPTNQQQNAWSNKWDYNENTIKAVKVNSAGHADTADSATSAASAAALANDITLWGIGGINAGSNVTTAPNLYIGGSKVMSEAGVQDLVGIDNLTMVGKFNLGDAIVEVKDNVIYFRHKESNKLLHIATTGDVVAYSGLDVEGLGLTVGMLKDVNVANLANGHALVWNGEKWINKYVEAGINENRVNELITASLAPYYNKTQVDVFLAAKASATDFDVHAGNATVHITAAERTAWNAKADASAIKTYGLAVSGNDIQIVEGGATKKITVPYATNAAKLDNVDGKYYLHNNHGYIGVETNLDSIVGFKMYDYAPVNGVGFGGIESYGSVINISAANSMNLVPTDGGNNWHWQLALSTSGNMYMRHITNDTKWKPWRQFAYIDSKVDDAVHADSANTADKADSANTADALAQTISIWGQNFNGTQNVDGIMSKVGHIYFDERKKDNGENVWSEHFLGRQGNYGYGAGFLFKDTPNRGDYVGIYDWNDVGDVFAYYHGTASIKPTMYFGVQSVFNGNVGIGTTSPVEKLHVNGNIRVGDAVLTYSNGILAFTDANGNPLHITASGDVVAYSGADVEGLNLSLGQLSNVNVNAATAGQALVYRNGVWVPETIQSGISSVSWSDILNKPTTINELGASLARAIRSEYTTADNNVLSTVTSMLQTTNLVSGNTYLKAAFEQVEDNYALKSTLDSYLLIKDAATTYLGINAKAADSAKLNGKSDSAFVHIAGAETITGKKTFSDNTYVNNIYVGNGKTIYENYNGANYNVLDVHPTYGVLSIGWGSARIPSSVLANDNNYGDTIIYGKGIILRAVEHKADGTFADKNAVRVLSNGYVGINDAYPSHPLHVNGSSRLAGNVTMGRDDSNAAVLYAVTVLGDRNVMELNNDNLHVGYGILGKGNTSLYGNNFYFYTHGQSTSVEITQLGLLYAKDGARFDCDIEINGNGGSRLPNHYYHKVYDDKGNVYEHFYDNLTSTPNSIANLRVASGGSFRTFRLDGYTNNGYDGLMSWDGDAMIQGKLQLGTNAKIWYDASIDAFRCNKTIVSDGDVVAFGGIGTIESPTLENLTVRNLNVTESAGVLRSESIRVKNTSLGGEDGNFTIGCPGDTYITSNSQFAAIFSQNGSWINKLFIGDSEEAISEVTVDKKYTSGSSGFYLHITINGERYRLTCYKES